MISIIVPVYNSERTIEACVKSILAQDHSDWELLLVDDGSEDKSLKLSYELARRDERISVLRQNHQGVAAARNLALKHMRGTHVCFIDSDDVVDADHLSRLFSKHDYDMVVCGYSVDEYDLAGEMTKQTKRLPKSVCIQDIGRDKQELKGLFMDGMIHINCNKLLKSIIIRENDLYYKCIPVNEDYMFMLDYLMCAESFCTIESSTYHWIRIENQNTGVSSLPDNLLQIYTDAHLLTQEFFGEKKMADEIMYNTYYFIVLKYLAAIETGRLERNVGLKRLREVLSNQYVRAAFNTRKNAALGERFMNTLLQHYQFELFEWINKMLTKQ